MSDDTLHGHHPHDADAPAADAISPTPTPTPPDRPVPPEADRSAAAPPSPAAEPALPADPDPAQKPAPEPEPAPAGPTGAAAPPPEVDPEVYASARAVIPRVLGLTGARSIVDVGCGTGAWVRACLDLGVPEVVGVDGPGLPDDRRSVATEFVERDPAEPLDLARRFNLVLCVDVAEDLPPERAPGLIADITTLAPVVVFAAAVPGQDATPHANERWPEQWVALFEDQGWTCRDAVRPWIRTNEQVNWRYRQTLFLAVSPESDAAYQSFPRLDPTPVATPVDYLRRPAALLPPPPPPIAGPPAPAAPAAGTAPPEPGGARPDGRNADETEPARNERVHTAADDPNAPADDDAGADGHTTAGDGGTADERSGLAMDEHPKPPGWDALVKLGRLARRRKGPEADAGLDPD